MDFSVSADIIYRMGLDSTIAKKCSLSRKRGHQDIFLVLSYNFISTAVTPLFTIVGRLVLEAIFNIIFFGWTGSLLPSNQHYLLLKKEVAITGRQLVRDRSPTAYVDRKLFKTEPRLNFLEKILFVQFTKTDFSKQSTFKHYCFL